MPTKKIVYIVHGYTAHGEAHWFPWLKAKLQNQGYDVISFNMPNSSNPKLKGWIEYLDRSVLKLDENTIFVGHSLGCVTVLNFLQNKKKKIKGVVLVSGFAEETPIPELQEFVDVPIDYALIKELIDHRIAISAIDDDIIPCDLTRAMSQKIGASYIEESRGRHFLDVTGSLSLPIVEKVIKEMS